MVSLQWVAGPEALHEPYESSDCFPVVRVAE